MNTTPQRTIRLDPKVSALFGEMPALLIEARARIVDIAAATAFDPELRALRVEIRETLFSIERPGRRTPQGMTAQEYLRSLCGWAARALRACGCDLRLVVQLESWAQGCCEIARWRLFLSDVAGAPW